VSLFFDTKRLLPRELAAPPCAHTRPKPKKSKPSGTRTRASSDTSFSSVKELIANNSRPTSPNATIARQTERQEETSLASPIQGSSIKRKAVKSKTGMGNRNG
jgi:hypothetical protein